MQTLAVGAPSITPTPISQLPISSPQFAPTGTPAPLRDPPAKASQPPGFAVETASLGSVGAELIHRNPHGGDALGVHFAVDRNTTAALIAGAADNLERSLAATGSRLDAVTVEVRASASQSLSASDGPGVGDTGTRGGDARQQPPAPRNLPQPVLRASPIKPAPRDRFA